MAATPKARRVGAGPHERRSGCGATAAGRIARTIADGVPNPKNYRGPMPPAGGAELSAAEISAVADYVWALSHRNPQ